MNITLQQDVDQVSPPSALFGVTGLFCGISAIVLWFVVHPYFHMHSPTPDAAVITNFAALGCLTGSGLFGVMGLCKGSAAGKVFSVFGLLICAILVTLIVVSRM